MGILKSELLPSADSENMYVNIEGPPGLTTSKTNEVAEKISQTLLEEKSIKSFSLVVGAAGVNVSDSISASASTQTNRAQFAINLLPLDERSEKSYEISQRLRNEFKDIQEAKIEVVELEGGPPTGSDIEATISGEDMLTLEKEANKYKEILSKIDGVINTKTSITLSPGEFTVKLDYDKMNLHGITTAQVSSLLRTALSSTEITKILQNNDEISVKANFTKDSLDSIDKIKTLKIANAMGQRFSLGEIAEISLGSSLTAINRIDGKRTVSISASVEKPHLPADIQTEFEQKIAKEQLPKGYEISFGGLQETNMESIYSILKAMIVAMILIVATLVLQFNSFKKALMILATIPFAVTGVFYGLTAMGLTLSFPALIGVVALFGVVVKNAVILVDKINLNLRVGIPFIEAIVDAAKSRLEAIFLTSTATIIGMIPITLTDETWAGMGASLIFGLSTSTLLTLIVIPILFKILNKKGHEKEERLRELKLAAENSSLSDM
jgi:HAE1 family hydrophobic/amphiphilic exporter-1